MISFFKKMIPENSFIRKIYSWGKALIASIIYGNPSKHLYVIGITGTDGKTTTSHFTAELMQNLGIKVALLSTEEIWINTDKQKNLTKRTTLSPFFIQKFLRKVQNKDCELVILEISSHALAQGRIFGIEFDGAIVTNISQEHGDYHKSLEEYASVKSRLFKLVKKSPKQKKILILNRDMDFYDLFAKIAPNISKTFALENSQTDITATELRGNSQETHFLLEETEQKIPCILYLPGTYNVENILAATLIARYFDFSVTEIANKISLINKVRGRLEEVKVPANFKVFVDFAVTPGALQKLLYYAQSLAEAHIILVFGCTGGNHDKEKRPMMGDVAAKIADYVVLTEDETYGEDNEKIMEEIEAGFPDNFIAYKKINKREEAIYFALKNAKSGDIVLVAGMGAFNSRNMGAEEEWSDIKVIQSFFN